MYSYVSAHVFSSYLFAYVLIMFLILLSQVQHLPLAPSTAFKVSTLSHFPFPMLLSSHCVSIFPASPPLHANVGFCFITQLIGWGVSYYYWKNCTITFPCIDRSALQRQLLQSFVSASLPEKRMVPPQAWRYS